MKRLAESKRWRVVAPFLAILSLLFLAGCAAVGTTSLGSLAGTLLLGAGLVLAALGIQGCGGGGSKDPAVINEGGGGGGRRIVDFPGRHTGLAGVNFRLAVGDLDGDGFPDTVSTGFAPGYGSGRVGSAGGPPPTYVVVNHNNTRGGLQPQGAYQAGDFAYGITLGDVDGDGDLDIVTADVYSDTISVLLNQGDGTFGAATPFPTDNGPITVALGDLDGDGDLDAVTANYAGGDVSVLEGYGDGTFGPFSYFNGYAFPFAVALGDVDGDGDLDIVVADLYANYDYNSYVSVFENDGGDFSNRSDFYCGYYPYNVALGDIDGDGDLDIAVDSSYYGYLYTLANDGTGDFSTYAYFFAYYPRGVALGDMNGDGNLDLVTGSYYGSNETYYNASVLLGDGAGGFGGATSFFAGEDPNFCALADANGDGRLDVFLSEPYSYTVGMLPGLGDGTLEEAPGFGDLGSGFFALAAADLDGDGDLDLAAADEDSNYCTLFFNDGAGGFTYETTILYGSGYQSVAIGDVNGDGFPDLVLCQDTDGANVAALLNDGAGNFSIPTSSDIGYGYLKSTSLGDVNGDGDLDLLTSDFYAGDAVVALGNGNGTFGSGTALDTMGYGTRNAVFGDLDGDGALDVVAANDNLIDPRTGAEGVGSPYTVAVFLNDGTGSFGAATTFNAGYGPTYAPRGLALGDLNGDGILDIAVTNGNNDYGFIQTLLGDGAGDFTDGGLSLTGPDPRGIALGDLDGDGILDLVSANDSSEDNAVLLGLGDGGFQSPFGFGSGYDPHDIAIGDFNGDGLPDFVSLDGTNGRNGSRTVEVFLQR